jgi:hypothetical protein
MGKGKDNELYEDDHIINEKISAGWSIFILYVIKMFITMLLIAITTII